MADSIVLLFLVSCPTHGAEPAAPAPTAERAVSFPAQGFELGASRASQEGKIPRGVPVVVERPDTLNLPGSLDPSLSPPPAITRLIFDVEGRLAVVEAVWPAGKPGEARLVKRLEEQVAAVSGPARARTGSRDIWWVTKETSTRLFERTRKNEAGEKLKDLVLRQERLGSWILN